ncbi:MULTISPECIES: hypothetical protein [Planktothricoides]|uniref:Uncharacterized protein n=1 Tax=Planktothricoides raciborskii FACHB-1370 TaxID=2949576 RepID=A0ABR8EBR9_9CYAN|nr:MULTISPECIES: hypothetical protein [Planktothricoides]KOR37839.1 hypothetical protein AM228_05155 [Planktothricoides sp. SR001]MBD2543614.1 hypothetical protein [Planktothricoides raciborskii FACHB-1370]MBD2581303.1 hypothetical protein [Planktothricoides raciborskii FACHB-1261]
MSEKCDRTWDKKAGGKKPGFQSNFASQPRFIKETRFLRPWFLTPGDRAYNPYLISEFCFCGDFADFLNSDKIR